MAYRERGSIGKVSGYVWYTRDANYTVTERDVGSVFKWYYKRRDIMYGGYVYNTEGAKQYFLQHIAPRVLDEVWNKIVSEGHEPLYERVRIVEVSPYFWDKYYFTYEIEFYFKILHASPFPIGPLVNGIIAIILAVLAIFIIQSLGKLAEQIAQGFQIIIHAIKDLITPIIPVILLVLFIYMMGQMFTKFSTGG